MGKKRKFGENADGTTIGGSGSDDGGGGGGGTQYRPVKRKRYDLSEQLTELLESLKSHRTTTGKVLCESFIRAPKRRNLPDYYEVVHQPIDLLRITQKVRMDEYDDLEQFQADIELLVNNAKAYYKPDTIEHQEANALWEVYQGLRCKYFGSDGTTELQFDATTTLLSTSTSVSSSSAVAVSAASTTTAPASISASSAEILGSTTVTASSSLSSSSSSTLYDNSTTTFQQQQQQQSSSSSSSSSSFFSANSANFVTLNEYATAAAAATTTTTTNSQIDTSTTVYDSGGGDGGEYKQTLDLENLDELGAETEPDERASTANGEEEEEEDDDEDADDDDDDDDDDTDTERVEFSDSEVFNTTMSPDESKKWMLYRAVKDTAMSRPFIWLPSQRRYPDYYQMIAQPICLMDIAKRLKTQKHYTTTAQVLNDLQLMLDNAMFYNRDDSQLYRDAEKLKTILHLKAKEILNIDNIPGGGSGGGAAAADSNNNPNKPTQHCTTSTTTTTSNNSIPPTSSSTTTTTLTLNTSATPTSVTPIVTTTTSISSSSSSSTTTTSNTNTNATNKSMAMSQELKKIRRSQKANDTRLKKRLRTLYDTLLNYEDPVTGCYPILPFMEKPSKKLYPDYYTIIERPIDMKTINSNIKNDHYKTEQQFVDDIALMFGNCRKYNEDESQLYIDAVRLESLLHERLQELGPFDEVSTTGTATTGGSTTLPTDSKQQQQQQSTTSAASSMKKSSTSTSGAVNNQQQQQQQSKSQSKSSSQTTPLQQQPQPQTQPLSGVQMKIKTLYDTVYNYVDTKSGRKLSEPFVWLPSDVKYPDYYQVIRKPICLDDIRQRVTKQSYTTVEDLLSDLILMFDNACQYNHPDSQLFKDALTLQQLTLQTKCELNDDGTDGTSGDGNGSVTAPNVRCIVQDLLTNLFISVCAYQDEEGRCFCDSINELVETPFMDFGGGGGINNDTNTTATATTTTTTNTGSKVELKTLNFDIIKRNLTKGRYRRLDRFQQDMFEVFDRARRMSRTDSQAFEDSIELQQYFIKLRNDLCKCGQLLSSPALQYDLLTLAASVDALRREKVPLELQQQSIDESGGGGGGGGKKILIDPPTSTSVVLQRQQHQHSSSSSTASSAAAAAAAAASLEPLNQTMVVHNDEVYHVGDFAYIHPVVANVEPHIVYIEAFKRNTHSGETVISGVWFYRPQQTYHLPSRRFLEQEVFKTDSCTNTPISQVVGKCQVMFVKDYFRTQPLNFDDTHVYVCESRYSVKDKSFKKIKKWPFETNVPLVARAVPKVISRSVPSVFKDMMNNGSNATTTTGTGAAASLSSASTTNNDEQESNDDNNSKQILDIDRPNVPCAPPEHIQVLDNVQYYEQFTIPAGTFRVGDCCYVRTDQERNLICRIDRMWIDPDGHPYFHGPWFVQQAELPPQTIGSFFPNEVFLSSIEDTNPLLSICERCCVLDPEDFVTQRRTEFDEKDVYICVIRYMEHEKRFTPLPEGELAKFIYQNYGVAQDEVYYFRNRLVLQKDSYELPVVLPEIDTQQQQQLQLQQQLAFQQQQQQQQQMIQIGQQQVQQIQLQQQPQQQQQQPQQLIQQYAPPGAQLVTTSNGNVMMAIVDPTTGHLIPHQTSGGVGTTLEGVTIQTGGDEQQLQQQQPTTSVLISGGGGGGDSMITTPQMVQVQTVGGAAVAAATPTVIPITPQLQTQTVRPATPATPVAPATPTPTTTTTSSSTSSSSTSKSSSKSTKPSTKRIVTGYIIFASEVRRSVVDANPDCSFGEISRIIGSQWKLLSQEAKNDFESRAKEQNAEVKAEAAAEKALQEQIAQANAQQFGGGGGSGVISGQTVITTTTSTTGASSSTSNSQSGGGGGSSTGLVREEIPNGVYECRWEGTCDYQFEDINDYVDHLIADPTGHVWRSYAETRYKDPGEFQCLMGGCGRVKKGATPFTCVPRLIRHCKEVHAAKIQATIINDPSQRSRNFVPRKRSGKPLQQQQQQQQQKIQTIQIQTQQQQPQTPQQQQLKTVTMQLHQPGGGSGGGHQQIAIQQTIGGHPHHHHQPQVIHLAGHHPIQTIMNAAGAGATIQLHHPQTGHPHTATIVGTATIGGQTVQIAAATPQAQQALAQGGGMALQTATGQQIHFAPASAAMVAQAQQQQQQAQQQVQVQQQQQQQVQQITTTPTGGIQLIKTTATTNTNAKQLQQQQQTTKKQQQSQLQQPQPRVQLQQVQLQQQQPQQVILHQAAVRAPVPPQVKVATQSIGIQAKPPEPLFMAVPPRSNRLLHTHTYMKYIESLKPDRRFISNWDKKGQQQPPPSTKNTSKTTSTTGAAAATTATTNGGGTNISNNIITGSIYNGGNSLW